MKTKRLKQFRNCRSYKAIFTLITVMSLSGLSFSGISKTIETFKSLKIEVVGEGDPVILLPPLGCSSDIWDATIENVFQNHRCYEINISGYAGQKAIEQPDFNVVINDILNYISRNKLKKIILVGHSFGGNLAMRIALKEPQLFSKLVIVDAYPFSPGILNPNVTPDQAKMQASMIENQFKSLPDSLYNQQQTITYSSMINDKELAKKVVNEVLKSDRKTIGRAYYETFSTDLRKELSSLKTQTLVLASWTSALQMGKDRGYIQEVLNSQYKNLVNCEILIANKANHFIMFDEPEWFYSNLTNFIK